MTGSHGRCTRARGSEQRRVLPERPPHGQCPCPGQGSGGLVGYRRVAPAPQPPTLLGPPGNTAPLFPVARARCGQCRVPGAGGSVRQVLGTCVTWSRGALPDPELSRSPVPQTLTAAFFAPSQGSGFGSSECWGLCAGGDEFRSGWGENGGNRAPGLCTIPVGTGAHGA